jgi:hypothetical protein
LGWLALRPAPEPPLPSRPPAPAAELAAPPPVEVAKPAPVATPREVEVIVRSSPRGAHVEVGGVDRAVTPARLKLALPQPISITLPGFEPVRLVVHKPGVVEVKLSPRAHRSRVYGERLD